MKLIAETAWHHEGDFEFMKELNNTIINESRADIVKYHLSLDRDEYMQSDHPLYNNMGRWMLGGNYSNGDVDWNGVDASF